MKIVRNLLILAVLALIAFLGVAFFSLNTLIKKGVEKGGPLALKAETRLESADILPFTGSGKLSGLFVGNPEGFKTPYALKVGQIHVQADLASVKTDTIVIQSVRIESPDIFIEGGLKEKNNLSALRKNIADFGSAKTQAKADPATESPKQPAKPGKKVIVKDLVITGAKVHWVSSLTLGQEVLLPLPDIHLTNLGEDKQGLTWSQLSNVVVDAIFNAAGSVSAENLNKAVNQLKEKGLENLNKAADGLKGLLK